MKEDCGCAEHARGNLAPLECKPLLGPFSHDFLLTDVVFELYDHPNGNQSRAGGTLWNTMPNQWSRRMLGEDVDRSGRQYHFETGLLCPAGSSLSVCSSLFVNQPTSRLWVVLSGCSCEEDLWVIGDLLPQALRTIDWIDLQPQGVIDPVDPTATTVHPQDLEFAIAGRDLLGTARDEVGQDMLWVEGEADRSQVAPGTSVALRVAGNEVAWAVGDTTGTRQCPDGTNLVVVRRSVDGRTIHWLCYREDR